MHFMLPAGSAIGTTILFSRIPVDSDCPEELLFHKWHTSAADVEQVP